MNSDLHMKLNQTHLLVLEDLLWRHGSAEAHHRDRGTGRSPLAETLLEFTINPTIEHSLNVAKTKTILHKVNHDKKKKAESCVPDKVKPQRNT